MIYSPNYDTHSSKNTYKNIVDSVSYTEAVSQPKTGFMQSHSVFHFSRFRWRGLEPRLFPTDAPNAGNVEVRFE